MATFPYLACDTPPQDLPCPSVTNSNQNAMRARQTFTPILTVTNIRIALKQPPKTEVIIIFALKQRNGDWARMRNGQRFVYSSRELAKRAARHLAKTHGWTEVVNA